uniref:Pectate lyase superfamily protein domain-containing protein n=1 Tax=Chromera velia CCMP2878 TaxID=1169474 RepID=A0A0G4GQ61_9ALVE|eukprot:Cvel_714.t1-p1 / transcript=Cvel_714.t1 / gene=Cvel_714 / organism=Chromera_velia_CCMP2878 / gene_product=Probable endo-xylogalacturonan hydrolase A, putative / transcript_product=Probable endo-xylogalacturonan hydrolase A, putative / location=Cvel_scaffold22:88601-93154(+) / protein_length=535 / sequence_SO=supercontig / SO=protein_coding / is_pseudo=false
MLYKSWGKSPLRLLLLIALLACSFSFCSCEETIFTPEDFGGVPNVPSREAAEKNSEAIQKALYAASEAEDKGDGGLGVVLIPAGHTYDFFRSAAEGIRNVELRVEGLLRVFNDIQNPVWRGGNGCLEIKDSANLRITGNGTVDGQGFDFWWHVILTGDDYRPNLFHIHNVTNIHIEGLTLRNSPRYHIEIMAFGATIRKIKIDVDITKQKAMQKKAAAAAAAREFDVKGRRGVKPSWLEKWITRIGLPTFPLNTDGIDPYGRDFLIEDCEITCFDDAVAVKPTGLNSWTGCTENIMVRNTKVVYGVGMTIGSVPPNENDHCIRNVTFENITFDSPFKAIYIKSNPGSSGTGIVEDITYRNIDVKNSVWMPIWIGPQQQRQPHTEGTGCSFLFPFAKKCPAQPLVSVKRVTLENIRLRGSWLLPGVLLADKNAPWEDVVFRNVSHEGALWGGKFGLRQTYYCDSVGGRMEGSSPGVGGSACPDMVSVPLLEEEGGEEEGGYVDEGTVSHLEDVFEEEGEEESGGEEDANWPSELVA